MITIKAPDGTCSKTYTFDRSDENIIVLVPHMGVRTVDHLEWIDENITGKVEMIGSGRFRFEDEVDAMAFKLVWG